MAVYRPLKFTVAETTGGCLPAPTSRLLTSRTMIHIEDVSFNRLEPVRWVGQDFPTRGLFDPVAFADGLVYDCEAAEVINRTCEGSAEAARFELRDGLVVVSVHGGSLAIELGARALYPAVRAGSTPARQARRGRVAGPRTPIRTRTAASSLSATPIGTSWPGSGQQGGRLWTWLTLLALG